MKTEVWIGILLPFLGTSLGAAMVFVLMMVLDVALG